jgi:hypothetical protein
MAHNAGTPVNGAASIRSQALADMMMGVSVPSPGILMVGMNVACEKLSTETSTNGYTPFCSPLPPYC